MNVQDEQVHQPFVIWCKSQNHYWNCRTTQSEEALEDESSLDDSERVQQIIIFICLENLHALAFFPTSLIRNSQLNEFCASWARHFNQIWYGKLFEIYYSWVRGERECVV